MANYVLVHGGDRDGSIWQDVKYLLEHQGHQVFCPSMTSVKHAHLQTNIDEVLAVIQANNLKEIILVGHSYGVMVITGVASQLSNALSFMVFVDSVVPQPGKSLYGLLAEYGFDYQSLDLTPDPACLDPLYFDSEQLVKMPKAYIRCLQSEFGQAIKPMYDQIVDRAKADHWLHFCLDTTHGCMLTQPKELAVILAGINIFQ